jgi:inositol phosphorylceramide mannosyltransferase catalytic subunit
MTTTIPKRIIQTGKHRTLSLKQRAMTTNLKLLNPDFEYVYFDDQDVQRFIDSEFPEHRKMFDAFRFPIQRFDFFRYLAVFRLGGFYFDLDVLLASDLSSLLTSSCVFPFEGLTFSRLLRGYGMDWEIGNYAFGAAAGHPFLEKAIENCVRAQEDPSWLVAMMQGVPAFSKTEHQVLYSTGPGLLSRTLAESPALAATVTVLFPEDVCAVETWNTFGHLGVHLMEGTWRPSTSVVRRRLAQKCESWALQRRLRESRRLGKTRALIAQASV